jgi:hypothetical protein
MVWLAVLCLAANSSRQTQGESLGSTTSSNRQSGHLS